MKIASMLFPSTPSQAPPAEKKEGGLLSTLTSPFKAASDAVSNGFRSFASGVSSVTDTVTSGVSSVVDTVVDTVAEPIKLTANFLKDLAGGVIDGVTGAVKAAGQVLLESFGLLDVIGGKDGEVEQKDLDLVTKLLMAQRGEGDPAIKSAVDAFLKGEPVNLDPQKYGDLLEVFQRIQEDPQAKAEFERLWNDPQASERLLNASRSVPEIFAQAETYRQQERVQKRSGKQQLRALRSVSRGSITEGRLLKEFVTELEEALAEDPDDPALRQDYEEALAALADYEEEQARLLESAEQSKETTPGEARSTVAKASDRAKEGDREQWLALEEELGQIEGQRGETLSLMEQFRELRDSDLDIPPHILLELRDRLEHLDPDDSLAYELFDLLDNQPQGGSTP